MFSCSFTTSDKNKFSKVNHLTNFKNLVKFQGISSRNVNYISLAEKSNYVCYFTLKSHVLFPSDKQNFYP